jgi:hypothetical protein
MATSANQTITLSPNRYIYANGKLVAASAVVIGDVLIATDGSEVTVVAVSQERSTGLFNPRTPSREALLSTSSRPPPLTLLLLHPRLPLAPLARAHALQSRLRQ